ncbi:MAG: germination protein YpeB [Clostridia bacterium]|nr:germination protein YpeB [Clostridia bacterium]
MDNSKHSIHIWLYSILGAALLLIFFWGIAMQRNAQALETSVENQYNRAFHDLVSYIDDIDIELTKAQLVNSPSQLSTLALQIFNQSSEAKAALACMPTSQVELDKTAKFLSQVADYTYVLSQDMINGNEISEEAYKNLASLNEYSTSLKQELLEIEQKIYSGELTLASSKNRSANTAFATDSDILASLENVEKSFDGYPSLIYDGPFSEHIENRESPMLKNAPQITRTRALKIASDFLGIDSSELKFQYLSENTAIESYNFTRRSKTDEISISVTRNGGYILSYLNNKENSGKENYDVDSAVKIARAYLDEHGFMDMENSYYEKTDNSATINFAYSDNGIICYSDLIKVKVALDSGEVIGLETNGYLMNHTDRDISAITLSSDDALSKVSKRLSANVDGLAIIPKDSLNEVLCYEIHGTFANKNFLIYINAQNGREEEILLLLESANGILTV